MEIRCKKGDCEHNTGVSCRAKAIKIEKGTAACGTYTHNEDKKNIAIKDGNLFNAAERMPARNTHNVPLKCAASKCLYNRTERCIANGILVIDNESSTCEADAACATFVEE